MNCGECPTFNVDDWIKVIQQSVDADEVERALLICDSVPAYYRHHRHPKLLVLRNSILSRMITAAGYTNDAHDCQIYDSDRAIQVVKGTLRGVLIENELNGEESYNVVDVGAGELWLPKGIVGRYSYKAIILDQNVKEAASKDPLITSKSVPIGNAVGVFVALEVIEHMPDPRDLSIECAKHFEDEPHYIHLSTPLFTYDASPKDNAKYLPHLRAYAPNEFMIEAYRLWGHYEWQLYMSGPIMSLRGLHPKAKRRERLI